MREKERERGREREGENGEKEEKCRGENGEERRGDEMGRGQRIRRENEATQMHA